VCRQSVRPGRDPGDTDVVVLDLFEREEMTGPLSDPLPDVRGMDADEAIDRLTAMGFEVDWETVESPDRHAVVVDQQPPPGTELQEGDTVLLTIAVAQHAAARNGDDDDHDGVPDGEDRCPETSVGSRVDDRGCPVAEVLPTPRPTPHPENGDGDEDGDGVPDGDDECPGTIVRAVVDRLGCSDSQILDKLPEGIYAFNAPDEMVVGREASYLVVLVLEPRPSVDVAEVERAVTEILERAAEGQIDDPIESRRRPYAERMSAELSGPEDWQIRPLEGSGGIRLIDNTTKTTWKWDVVPVCVDPSVTLECSEARLSLAVMAHFGDAREPWPLIQEQIVVRITMGKVLRDFLANNWQWLWTALLVPAFGLWLRRRRAGKRRPDPVKVLFLAANPADTEPLSLDEEVRAIDAAIRGAEFRDRFDLRQHWAVRSTELDDFLLRHRPGIVHFSGHGSEASELLLVDPGGAPPGDPSESRPVAPETLSRLFSALSDNVRLVVLNACFSERQACAIADHIDCVVGMSREITDEGAVSFATALYQALAYGRDVRTAFDLACLEAGLTVEGEEATPRLIADRKDPRSIVFVEAADDTTPSF
jgi:hypothetical protein